MSALDGVQYKHESKIANFGSTLKRDFNENNKIFQPYFKPQVKSEISKESDSVLRTKNPERKIDEILHDVKESKQLEVPTEEKKNPFPGSPPVKKAKKKEKKRESKDSQRKVNPPKKKKKIKKISIFDGYHV